MNTLKVPEEYFETLENLGLTYCQAKVYLATVQNGTTTAKKISETTHIARPHIYQIIDKLEKLGLIEKTMGKPALIKAIPLQVAISFLVNRKRQETQYNTKRAQKIIHYFKNNENKSRVNNYKTEFVWLSKNKPYLKKRLEEIDNAKTCIDFVSSWKRFPLTVYTFSENAKSALERNVKIRVILEKPPNDHTSPNIVQELEKYPNYQLKYILDPPPAIIAIFDKKRTIIDTSSSVGLAEAPALWTGNPCFLSILSDYFEIMWITAIEKRTQTDLPIKSDLCTKLYAKKTHSPKCSP